MEKIPTKLKPSTVLYAIQRKSDGAWSRGGSGPTWGKFPKTWGKGAFKNHLLMFKVDGYGINITQAKKDEKSGYCWRSVAPGMFGRYKLLHNKLFPYFDCEVVEIKAEDMTVVNRYPAEPWVWDNCFKPNYEKIGGYGDGRYLKQIKEYCKEYGLDFE
jgi:hypothetical protein